MAGNLYVQYGCGFSAPEGWKNYDSSPTLFIERLPTVGRFIKKNKARFPSTVQYGDIVKGLPVADSTCRAVYCSHILEHLSLTDCRKAIENTYRILAPGGVFRLVLPDLEKAVSDYISNDARDASVKFMRQTCLGHEKRQRGIKSTIIAWLGNSAHLWMWDFKSLSHELSSAGFTGIRRASFNDCEIPQFKLVELQERWKESLGIECLKT